MKYNPAFPKTFDKIEEIGHYDQFKDDYREVNFFNDYENNNLDAEDFA